jgi:hypothetical protein
MAIDPIEAHFGPGPVTQALLAWTRGEIGADVARDRLTQPQVVDAIDVDEFGRLSDRTVRWAYQGHWQQALTLHDWLAEMMMAAPQRLGPYVPAFMLDHLRVVTVALWHRPDAARYRRAVALAEGLLAQPSGLSARTRSKLAHELGVLHLDPWVANRGSRQAVEQWVREATTPAQDGGPVIPGGAEAMDRAEHWLREALPAAQGVDRLETLKALLQCLFGREGFGGQVDEAAVRPLLDEAGALLPQAPHRGDIADYLQMVARRIGATPVAAASAPAAADEDWDTRVAQLGIEIVFSQVFAALREAAGGDRDAGLLLVKRVAPLIDAHASESNRLTFHQQVVQLLAGPPADDLPEAAQVAARLHELADAPLASPRERELLAQVLGWVMGFTARDHESSARALVNALARMVPRLWDDWGTALNLLAGELDVGAGVNALNAGHVDEAVQQYYSAWSTFRALRFDDRAVGMLGRIADLLPRGSPRLAQIVCELVREQSGPQAPAAIEPWQRACTQLAGAATRALEAGGSADAWYAAARLAKGPSYGALVARPQAWDWRTDPEAAGLVHGIRALEAEFDAGAVQAARLEYGDLFEQVLVSYRSVGRDSAGATPAERRDNLARQLDLLVRARLAALADTALPRFTLDEVAARLPGDAVLLDLFLPRAGAAMGYCLAVAAGEQRLFGVRGDDGGIRGVVIGGTTSDHELTPSTMLVAELRQHMPDDPPPGAPATAEVLAALASQARRFLGDAVEWLQQQHAAGKRHLVVVPSGPLHFHPVHLLGLDGRTLADDWTVTYLPSLDLLRGDRPPGAARTGAAVFALGYEAAGAPALPPLPGAVAEGQAVAQALGVVPTPEAEATPSRVTQALAQAAVVHVACHGEHDVIAPSLQCLRLVPEAGGDGRLSALDLLALDLRGLSVLGLSACETALGRFDLGDNLQGLAANALARGVDAVVGTLWPCADDASAVFFAALYRELAAGASRRDAFRAAQLRTRRDFGEHRDWAAFYLSGLW